MKYRIFKTWDNLYYATKSRFGIFWAYLTYGDFTNRHWYHHDIDFIKELIQKDIESRKEKKIKHPPDRIISEKEVTDENYILFQR